MLTKIAPHAAILTITALSAPGSMVALIEVLFFAPLAILRLLPIALGLIFYLKKQYDWLYILLALFCTLCIIRILTAGLEEYMSMGWLPY